MQRIGEVLQQSYPRPIKKRETDDLRCPRCQRVIYAHFYESYHYAPWAALRSELQCECGYRMSL